MNLRNPFRSSLRVAGGTIEAWELLRLAPKADMIVLSACDTDAAGGFAAGLDSSSASIAAFAMAGQAHWIVASLWAADDGTTNQVMKSFYRAMIQRKSNPAEALRQAKIEQFQNGIPGSAYGNIVLVVPAPSALRTDLFQQVAPFKN